MKSIYLRSVTVDLNQQNFTTFLYNVPNSARFSNIFLLTWHPVFRLVIRYCRYKSSVDKADVHQRYDTTHHNYNNIAAINSTDALSIFALSIIQEIVFTVMWIMVER